MNKLCVQKIFKTKLTGGSPTVLQEQCDAAKRKPQHDQSSSFFSAQKTPLPTVTPLLHVTQLLPSNGCFTGSTVLVLSKYATTLSHEQGELGVLGAQLFRAMLWPPQMTLEDEVTKVDLDPARRFRNILCWSKSV
jgi:hypothetical protein